MRWVGNVCACATEPINATALSAAKILRLIMTFLPIWRHGADPKRPKRTSHDWRLRIHLQRGDKGFLGYVDLAELSHLLLAGLLLLEQLAFAGGVAAVAFRGDVLAQRPDCLTSDDLAA